MSTFPDIKMRGNGQIGKKGCWQKKGMSGKLAKFDILVQHVANITLTFPTKNSSGPPLEYSTMSGCRCTFLLSEYSTKESSTSPTFLVLKVSLEVLHDSGTALFTTGMYLLDPFSKIRRSPLDPVSRRILIVLCLTISLSLVSFGGGLASFRHFFDRFRSYFFDLDSN
jgi:hypothetical protein